MIITEENKSTILYQKYILLHIRIGFIAQKEIVMHNNMPIYTQSKYNKLKSIFSNAVIDNLTLLACSWEVNSVKLILNIIVQ